MNKMENMNYYDNLSSQNLNNHTLTVSSCYFCNDSMDSKYLSDHVAHCGAVLEECPEKCGAYIPRNELQEHRNQCLRGLGNNVQRTSDSLEDKIKSLRESAWKNKVVSILGLLRTAVFEGEKEIKELRDTLASSLQLTNEALRKDILEELFESRRSANSMNIRLSNLEKSYTELQYKFVQNIQHTNVQIDNLKFETTNEQHRSMEEREKCYAVLEEMKANFTAESATICRLWQEQVKNIHDMKLELEMRCKLSKELVNKYNSLFDRVEALEKQIQKNSEAVAEQAVDAKTLRFQMKDNVEYIEEILKEIENKPSPYHECHCQSESIPIGHLIWRIDRFKEKMEEAKLNDSVLASPIFYDKEYGYTLRMELRLNGMGHWKNRHVIGCLRIVDGKWDPLLTWPCILKADVTLRDQDNSINNVDKFVRAVKKGNSNEELEHNSDLYMFIPHTTLARHSGYTKNNVMFLEIRVKDNKFKGSTMSLV